MREGGGDTVRCVSNEHGPEADAPASGAPPIDASEHVASTPSVRILAADDDLVCIDDACAPVEPAR